MNKIIVLKNNEEFYKICEKNKHILIVCDFWASWCSPCLKIAPFYEQLSEKYKNVLFLKADIEKLDHFTMKHKISSIPTFKFFRNGKELYTIKGANKKKLEEIISKAQAGNK